MQVPIGPTEGAIVSPVLVQLYSRMWSSHLSQLSLNKSVKHFSFELKIIGENQHTLQATIAGLNIQDIPAPTCIGQNLQPNCSGEDLDVPS